MKQEKKLLEVGDVVFRTDRGGGNVVAFKIDRVTKTLAVSDRTKFKRGVMRGYVTHHPYQNWNSYIYQLPTPELKTRLKHQKLRSELKWYFYEDDNQPTLPQLLSIKNILTNQPKPQPTPPLVEWIPIEDVDMGEGVTNKEGMENWRVEYLGVNKEGRMLRGYYFENKGKKYIEDDDGWIHPTHIIPLTSLLKLPTKPSTK